LSVMQLTPILLGLSVMQLTPDCSRGVEG